jgi:hypothetical protein
VSSDTHRHTPLETLSPAFFVKAVNAQSVVRTGSLFVVDSDIIQVILIDSHGLFISGNLRTLELSPEL